LVPGARTTGLSKMIKKPGLVLKYRNRERFVIRQGYETALPTSTEFNLKKHALQQGEKSLGLL